MNNSIFVYGCKEQVPEVKRFHFCTWEFKNATAIVEIGAELDWQAVEGCDDYSMSFFIPWVKQGDKVVDLYNKLKLSSNAKFIFNDPIEFTTSLDGGNNQTGVIHAFYENEPLAVLPLKIEVENSFVRVKLSLGALKNREVNPYFRFYIKTDVENVSTRKHGLNKSTIIYDVRVNEKRNLPETLVEQIQRTPLANIQNCFCLHIIPNDFELSFFDSSLKNLRAIEDKAFKEYLDDRLFKDEELMVMFKKKRSPDSFSFFSTFTKERIGAGQFAFAAFTNLVCGFLLYIPSIRGFDPANKSGLQKVPSEFWLVLFILLIYG